MLAHFCSRAFLNSTLSVDSHYFSLLHTGYVSTILNRRRWLPHIKSYDFTQRSQAERQAVNFIVQGLCMCRYNHALLLDIILLCLYSVSQSS